MLWSWPWRSPCFRRWPPRRSWKTPSIYGADNTAASINAIETAVSQDSQNETIYDFITTTATAGGETGVDVTIKFSTGDQELPPHANLAETGPDYGYWVGARIPHPAGATFAMFTDSWVSVEELDTLDRNNFNPYLEQGDFVGYVSPRGQVAKNTFEAANRVAGASASIDLADVKGAAADVDRYGSITEADIADLDFLYETIYKFDLCGVKCEENEKFADKARDDSYYFRLAWYGTNTPDSLSVKDHGSYNYGERIVKNVQWTMQTAEGKPFIPTDSCYFDISIDHDPTTEDENSPHNDFFRIGKYTHSSDEGNDPNADHISANVTYKDGVFSAGLELSKYLALSSHTLYIVYCPTFTSPLEDTVKGTGTIMVQQDPDSIVIPENPAGSLGETTAEDLNTPEAAEEFMENLGSTLTQDDTDAMLDALNELEDALDEAADDGVGPDET